MNRCSTTGDTRGFRARSAWFAARALACGLALLSSAGSAQAPSRTQTAASPDELVGLWKAKRRFGPDGWGPLVITRAGATYIADLMGRQLLVREEGGDLSFELPNNEGSFRGRVQQGG